MCTLDRKSKKFHQSKGKQLAVAIYLFIYLLTNKKVMTIISSYGFSSVISSNFLVFNCLI